MNFNRPLNSDLPTTPFAFFYPEKEKTINPSQQKFDDAPLETSFSLQIHADQAQSKLPVSQGLSKSMEIAIETLLGLDSEGEIVNDKAHSGSKKRKREECDKSVSSYKKMRKDPSSSLSEEEENEIRQLECNQLQHLFNTCIPNNYRPSSDPFFEFKTNEANRVRFKFRQKEQLDILYYLKKFDYLANLQQNQLFTKWEEIAENLNRTTHSPSSGIIVYQHYLNNILPGKNKTLTEDEKNYLCRQVELYDSRKSIPWMNIHAKMQLQFKRVFSLRKLRRAYIKE